MRLVDSDNFSLSYAGLVYIFPYDFAETARYFARQFTELQEVEAVPCDFIKECIKEGNGPEKTYYRKLLSKWKKRKAEIGRDKFVTVKA